MLVQLNAKRQAPNASGFTLVELLITISVLTIIATIGILNFSGVRTEQDIGNSAQLIVSILREAQTRSIGQEDGYVWGVHFINSGLEKTYTLFRGAVIPPAQGDIGGRYALPQALTFISPAEGSSTTIRFSAITGLPVSPGIVRINALGGNSSEGIINVEANGIIKSVINN